MSKAKDRARAIAGNPHRTTSEPLRGRVWVCANCHKPLGSTYVKVGDYLFHQNCPKIMKPLTKKEMGADDKQREI